jgi:ATP-binding cassette subfamily C protein/ATP-binding cassette subfamily C protein LapB
MNVLAGTLPAAAPGFSAAWQDGGALLAQHPPGIVASDLTRCFAALLALLGWDGGADDMLGALPHAEARPDLTDIRNALARLGHPTRAERLRRGRLDPRRLPALLIRRGRPAAVLYRDPRGGVLLFDGATGETRGVPHWHLAGTLYLPQAPVPAMPQRGSWVGTVARRFAPAAPALLGMSALVTLCGLAVPVFTMLVFDLVVAGRSAAVLAPLLAGVLLALAAEIGFRGLRQRVLARIGARLDRLISDGVFSQIVALPAALVERAGAAAQVSRLRDFAAIREMLTGSFALAVLDLPFTLLVLALLLLLGGYVALVPVAAAALFVLLFLATRGAVKRAVNAASQATQARDVLAIELLEAHRSLRLAGAEQRWAARHAAAAAAAAIASARAAALSSHVMAAAQAIVTLSGLTAMAVGVTAVLAGGMTAGALIAGMMLIWRVLAPMQAAFVMLSRWEQTAASVRQVDGMMALETERTGSGTRMAPPTRGDIVFQRVSLRYLATAEPVLAGASFAVRHGEVVAITGGDGAGKSSLLRLVAGLYRPQGGVVRVGGHDVRAFDPAVLRRSVAFVPQLPDLLYGTIAQNLRLALPSATDDDLRRAAADARVLDAIEALPGGFETRVGDNATARLPRSVVVRLCLARALLRDAPVLLLDEPAAGLDDACAAAFEAIIAARRGHATVLMTTHRPSHMRLADRVLRIADGAVEEVPGSPQAAAPMRLPVFQTAVPAR